MRRVFSVDVLECPVCQGPMKIIAEITQPEVIERFLAALDLPTEHPEIERARRRRSWSCLGRIARGVARRGHGWRSLNALRCGAHLRQDGGLTPGRQCGSPPGRVGSTSLGRANAARPWAGDAARPGLRRLDLAAAADSPLGVGSTFTRPSSATITLAGSKSRARARPRAPLRALTDLTHHVEDLGQRAGRAASHCSSVPPGTYSICEVDVPVAPTRR